MLASTWRTRAYAAVSIAGLLFAWTLAAHMVGREIILPGPASVGHSLAHLVAMPGFRVHLGATLVRGLVGFALSYSAGLAAGLAAGLSRPVDSMMRPLMVTIRSTPSMALILLALIWFKSDAVAIFVTFLVVFPIVAQNVTDGLRAVDPSLVQMARLFRVRPSRIVRELYIPAIVPYLAAGATAGLGLTWKVMISAEVLAGPKLGIGTQMDNARVFLNTADVLAWTVIVVIIGFLFDRVLESVVQKRLLHWQ